jgi:hypothetical protein
MTFFSLPLSLPPRRHLVTYIECERLKSLGLNLIAAMHQRDDSLIKDGYRSRDVLAAEANVEWISAEISRHKTTCDACRKVEVLALAALRVPIADVS